MTPNDMVAPVQHFAPAKINLTLHVTGQRADGYHLLDSLVVFADVGDRLTLSPSDSPSLTVSGPLADGVPTDERNLVLKAMDFAGLTASAHLDKHLPAAAGIGGGSSDAAAALRGLSDLYQTELPDEAHRLGADIPVCLIARAARMEGIGDRVSALPPMPPLHAVLVNPGVAVSTPKVFANLISRTNSPMGDLPNWTDTNALIAWLSTMRNDMEPAACALAPEIGAVLDHLKAQPECLLARMSGSGATCFALTQSRAEAEAMAKSIAKTGWWVMPTTLT